MKALFSLAARSAIQHDPELKQYFYNRMAKGANGNEYHKYHQK